MIRQLNSSIRLAGLAVVVILVVLTGSRIGIAQAPTGWVAAYAFAEASGATVTDASGNGNNGTVTNTIWSGNGRFGSALQFNGTTARVTIPDTPSLHLTTAMTLEAWVNP